MSQHREASSHRRRACAQVLLQQHSPAKDALGVAGLVKKRSSWSKWPLNSSPCLCLFNIWKQNFHPPEGSEDALGVASLVEREVLVVEVGAVLLAFRVRLLVQQLPRMLLLAMLVLLKQLPESFRRLRHRKGDQILASQFHVSGRCTPHPHACPPSQTPPPDVSAACSVKSGATISISMLRTRVSAVIAEGPFLRSSLLFCTPSGTEQRSSGRASFRTAAALRGIQQKRQNQQQPQLMDHAL